MHLTLKPSDVNTGITFVRNDTSQPVRISAHVQNVTRRPRRTSLRNGSVTLDTVEHTLAALAGMNIDNAIIELDNVELPAWDGSSKPLVDLLEEVGSVTQPQRKKVLRVVEPVHLIDGERMIAALPGDPDKFSILYDLDYGADSPVGRQVFGINLTRENFIKDIAPARTFVTEQEAQTLQAEGIGEHLSATDVVVLGSDGPLGGNNLRYPDECVRHKICDMVGDLALLGYEIRGRIVAYRSGHALNHALVRKLMQQAVRLESRALASAEPTLDIRQLQRLLPHRFPFLLIDRVIELEGDRRAVGIKNVTINEPFFQGHFPSEPIMPAVLIVEAMAQLYGVLLSRRLEHTGKLGLLLSMDRVKIRHPVRPGDQVILEAEALRVKLRTGHVRCRARVGEKLAAEAVMKFMMVDADQV